MKKSLVIVCLVLVLIISLSIFVSAGFFSDLFGKITGKTIGPGECPDTDALLPYQAGYDEYTNVGKNPYLKGTFDGDSDYCTSNTLTEYYCYDAGFGVIGKSQTDYFCGSFGMVCLEGACVEEGTPPPLTCSESDGGDKIYIKGNCIDSSGTSFDTCETGTLLTETYCSNNICVTNTNACPSGYVCESTPNVGAACVADGASSSTCDDGIQNQGEFGVDCGGPCPNFCFVGCIDDNDCTSPLLRCDSTSECVECLSAGDCNSGEDCIDKECIAVTISFPSTCESCITDAKIWCNDGQNNCVSSPSQCSDSYYVVGTTFGCTNHCSNFETCQDCVGVGKGYTWCEDLDKCVAYPSMEDGCDDKANHDYECGEACKNQQEEYLIGDLTTDEDVKKLIHSLASGCGLSFEFDVLDILPSGYTLSSTINRRVVKVLNITSDASGVQTDIDLVLNESELGLKFSIKNVTIYIEEGKSSWNPLIIKDITATSNEREYTYRFSTNHFSLFLITEPELCGNEVFDSGFEDCDGSVSGVANCTACVCDTGYDKNASGFCLEDIGGKKCSPAGNETCKGYTLYECGSDLKWDNKGKVIGKCSVVCYPIGNMSCQGEIPLRCGTDYDWDLQSKISGLCGYVSGTTIGYNDTTSDRCGNGYCNYDEDEFSCPVDCADEPSPDAPNWGLIALVVGIAILILVIIIVLFKIFSKERRGMPPPNRRLPPEHRPGPKRAPGRPLEHSQPAGRPAVRQGAYPRRRYPVR